MGYGLYFKIFLFGIFCLFSFVKIEAREWEKEVYAQVSPYLLPENHPIKPSLDYLFSLSRVTLSLESLEKAGFMKAKPRKFTKLIVTKHPSFPGYIFKLYLDAQAYYKDQPEHYFWLLRIQGAEKIRQELAINDRKKRFKVPKKWIYALPTYPQLPKGYPLKQFILVEEDMDIFSNKENKALWKSDYVTPELLDELYILLKKLGLNDCAKPENIPFSKDGKIAFIDTQSHGNKVEFKRLSSFLSESNKLYWKQIIKNNTD